MTLIRTISVIFLTIFMSHLWFRAKTYGYGWTPCSWQGWLVLLAYIALSLLTFLTIDAKSHSGSDMLLGFVPLFLVYTFVLILICVKTGEKAKWRWGKKY